MDDYQGNNQNPLSLYKYIYIGDNPETGTDPTGFWREIDSNWVAGKDAEAPVVADFTTKRGITAASLKSVHGILDYASRTGFKRLGCLVPDLIDLDLYEIYDVKSWKEVPDGMMKIQTYRVAFYLGDPDPARAEKWHADLTYDYNGPNPVMMPGTSNGKRVWAMYFPTEAGVVPCKLYEVDNDEYRKRIAIPVHIPVRIRDRELEHIHKSCSVIGI